MAAAIGAGLPVAEPTGSMVVDIGGGTAEVAVISLGDIVTSCSVRVAGDKFDESIISYVKKKYNLLIGERTAEQIKISIGSAFPDDEVDQKTIDIKGRNLVDGLPKNVSISALEVREALTDPLSIIVDAIKSSRAAGPCCAGWTGWWSRRPVCRSMWRTAPWTAWWTEPANGWIFPCPPPITRIISGKRCG